MKIDIGNIECSFYLNDIQIEALDKKFTSPKKRSSYLFGLLDAYSNRNPKIDFGIDRILYQIYGDVYFFITIYTPSNLADVDKLLEDIKRYLIEKLGE